MLTINRLNQTEAKLIIDGAVKKANDLGIIVSVWLNPSVATDDNLDHQILFDIHRKATAQAIHKAMNHQPSIDWLLENQENITHKYFQMGLDGKI